jgi:hypothetical protein
MFKNLFIGFYLFSFNSFGSEKINIINSVNVRLSPNFLSINNIVGRVALNSTAEVIQSKTLPSGNKAYQIKVSSLKPKSNIHLNSTSKYLWVYGSSRFVSLKNKSTTEAVVEVEQDCSTCKPAQTKNNRHISAIPRFVEAENSAKDYEGLISSEAQKMIQSLQSQGFICNLKQENIQKRGIGCKGKISSYPEPVRIYIPKNYIKSEQNNLNFFFHGFEEVKYIKNRVTKKKYNNIYKINANNTKGAGDFGARLAESGNSTGIIVVPESRGEGRTYQYFADGSGQYYQKFKDQIEKITDSSFSKITFAAHSGGRLPMAALLNYPAIAETVKNIALFDTAYSDALPITNWINKYPDSTARISWTLSGEVVEKTKVFISNVERKEQLTLVPSKGTHMDNIYDGGYSEFLKN